MTAPRRGPQRRPQMPLSSALHLAATRFGRCLSSNCRSRGIGRFFRPRAAATPTYVAPVAVRTPQKPKEPERPSITLLGTILGTSESIGVFLNPAKRDIVRLRLGEHHEGWALRSVKTREVTLVKDRERVVLELPPPGDQAAAADFAPPEPTRQSQPARRQQRR
jgi:hypothetical protein